MEGTVNYIDTAAGRIAFRNEGDEDVSVLFVHGNSFSSQVFRHQFTGALKAEHRLIAIDLPGHGRSGDASDPASAYTLPGYAGAVREVMDALNLKSTVLVGWSLGGHVVMEVLSTDPSGIAGVVISGAPPIDHDPATMAKAFNPTIALEVAFKESIDQSEAKAFIATCLGVSDDDVPPVLLDETMRTDGKARTSLVSSLQEGRYADEVSLVGRSLVPIAVIEGENDPCVRRDYLDGLSYASRWRERTTVIGGCGHMPFWESPDLYNKELSAFLDDIT